MLEQEAVSIGVLLDKTILQKHIPLDGLYMSWSELETIILINIHRPLSTRVSALAEELGHHYKSHGIIVPQRSVTEYKREQYGRNYAYQRLLPQADLRVAMKSGVGTLWELAELFNLPESFVAEAMAYYQRKPSSAIQNAQCHWCYAH